MAQPQLILASTSPWRKQLLERLNVPFETVSPDVLEAQQPGESPAAMARRLALAKARAVAARHPGAVVIGSDQTCTLNGDLLRKPGNSDAARRQLLRASGESLVFHTAVAVIRAENDLELADVSEVEATLRTLRADEVSRYVELEDASNCAGGFRAEALGICLFDRIRSDDPSSLIGLPLILTTRLLRQAGIDPLA